MHAMTVTRGAMRKRIVLRPNFADTIARTGLTMTEFAATAGVERTTLYALMNPSQHPNRKGGMIRATAWKIANAYAGAAGVSPDEAYAALLAEELR
jgi:predicted DNA-binding transcriptional regulator AlpA